MSCTCMVWAGFSETQHCTCIVCNFVTSSQGPVDQPCLRLAVRPHDNFSSDHPLLGTQRSPVCTFCLTNQKKVVSVRPVTKWTLYQSLNLISVNSNVAYASFISNNCTKLSAVVAEAENKTYVAYSVSKTGSLAASEEIPCMFIAMFTKASNSSLSWKTWSQSRTSHSFSFKIHLIFIFQHFLRYPTWLSLQVSDPTLYVLLFPFMQAKYLTYLILDMITLMILGKMSKLQSSCKGISLQPPVTPSIVGPHALPYILFSSILLLCFCIWLIRVKIRCSLKFFVYVSKD